LRDAPGHLREDRKAKVSYYGRDNASYIEWDEVSADRERFHEWMRTNVLEASPEDFAARVRKLRNDA